MKHVGPVNLQIQTYTEPVPLKYKNSPQNVRRYTDIFYSVRSDLYVGKGTADHWGQLDDDWNVAGSLATPFQTNWCIGLPAAIGPIVPDN